MRDYFNPGGSGMNNGGFKFPGILGKFVNIMDLVNMFKKFLSNPVGALLESGLNIPSNISNNVANNPEAVTNYLRSSGAMTEEQYQQASEFASTAQQFLNGIGFGRK
jgi:hypothetical protein